MNTTASGAFPHNMNNTDNHSTTWTSADLERLNDAKAGVLVPAMIVLGLFTVVGVIGNSLVCYIMGFKLRMNTQHLFIITLAIFDLANCLICIPSDIYSLRHYYRFPSAVGCKIVRGVMFFTNEASIFTLLVIALDRYLKVCKPLKRQLELRHVKWCVVAILICAALFSWPTLLLYGLRSVETGVPGISGKDCSYSDSVKDTPYPMAFKLIILLIVLVTTCVILIVIYSRILVSLRQHTRHLCSGLDTSTRAKCDEAPTCSCSVEISHRITYSNSVETTAKTVLMESVDSENRQDELTTDADLNVYAENIDNEKAQHDDTPTNTQCHNNSQTSTESEKCEEFKMELKSKATNNTENASCVDREYSLIQADAKDIILPVSANDTNISENILSQELKAKNTGLDSPEFIHVSGLPAEHSSVSKVKGDHDHTSHVSFLTKESSTSYITTEQEEFNLKESASKNNDKCKYEAQIKKKSSHYVSKLDRKTTMVGFLVTLVFILSYLPYMSLNITKQIFHRYDYDLQGAGLVLYNIFFRSYYFNSIANPFIYGFLNIQFRRNIVLLISRISTVFFPKCGDSIK